MQTRDFRQAAQGFTLVDVMVGMVIGMIGMIVMMQVFLASDASKRSSSGGSDAQTNGTGALYVLQRDLRQSGNGITSKDLMGCSLVLPSGATLALLAPVQVNAAQIPAGDAASDTLMLVYGSGSGSPDGDVIVSQPNSSTYSVTVPMSVSVGDWVVALPAGMTPCALTLEQVQARSSSPPEVTVTSGVAIATTGSLFNLGPAPRVLAYAVRGARLTVCDFMVANCSDNSLLSDPTVWIVLASNIASMRVQYGRDMTPAASDGIVDGFDQVTPGSPADVSGLPLMCTVARVLAARLVLVARSATFEKTEVTSVAPLWAGSAAAPVDLSALPAWKNYRYKSFETLVPLRNLLSAGVPRGC